MAGVTPQNIIQNPSLPCPKPTGSLYHTQNKYQSPAPGPAVSLESRPLSCLPGSLLPRFSAGMLFLEHTKQAAASQASPTASAQVSFLAASVWLPDFLQMPPPQEDLLD